MKRLPLLLRRGQFKKMTFITKGNKLFYAACAALFSIPDGYIRDLQHKTSEHLTSSPYFDSTTQHQQTKRNGK